MANLFFSDVTDVKYRLIRPCVMGMGSPMVGRYGSKKLSSYIKYVRQYLDLGSEIAERLGLSKRGKNVKIRIFITMARTMMGMPGYYCLAR